MNSRTLDETPEGTLPSTRRKCGIIHFTRHHYRTVNICVGYAHELCFKIIKKRENWNFQDTAQVPKGILLAIINSWSTIFDQMCLTLFDVEFCEHAFSISLSLTFRIPAPTYISLLMYNFHFKNYEKYVLTLKLWRKWRSNLNKR